MLLPKGFVNLHNHSLSIEDATTTAFAANIISRRTLPFVSAASGLVVVDTTAYVIADDELDLFAFDIVTGSHQRWPLLAGTLPEEKKARKKQKPDWEILCELNRTETDFSLLALPSGSRPQRNRAMLCRLQRDGTKLLSARLIDCTQLYQVLSSKLAQLNLEAMVVTAENVFLFHRATGSGQKQLLLRLDKDRFLHDLNQDFIGSSALQTETQYELNPGNIWPLAFTDACYFNSDLMLGSAVVEPTEDVTEDAPTSQIQIILFNFKTAAILQRWVLSISEKIEGVALINACENRVRLLCVSDADDRQKASQLFELELPLDPMIGESKP